MPRPPLTASASGIVPVHPTGTVTLLATSAGDPPLTAFAAAEDALAAALAARAADPTVALALHTGEARRSPGGRYEGAAADRARELGAAAGPGQILVSARTAALLDGTSLHDLGLHRLRDLLPAERLYAPTGEDGAEPAPPASLDAERHNLPVQLTSFVGRDAERAGIHEQLAASRLVTLTGAGGTGKTRLAARVGAEQLDLRPDGVWWVDLAPAADPTTVADLVAAATGVLVEPVQGALASLTRRLADRRLLICLDNCEHLLDAAAEVAEALLRTCPEVAVLTTSREPLGVPGEAVRRVPPLRGDEALALFLERGSAVRPWLTLDRSSEAAIRTLCDRLDGMPLAVELAAAWLGTLTPQQIEAGLDDRFALLVRGPRSAAARQQTLAASIDWSHDLLDDLERAVFRRLAVFAGGFTLDAAQAVCAPTPAAGVLRALGRLVDKSLVVAGDGRYRLLESIRSYAAERLAAAGEADAVRDRHLDHLLELAERAAPLLETDKDAWRARMEAEYENLRAALDWSLAADDPTRGRRLAAELPWLWHLHGRGHEGFEVLQRALRRAPDDRSVLQGRLLMGVALVVDTTQPLELEFDIAREALEIADAHGDRQLRAMCLNLAAVGRFYTDFDAAWELMLEAERCGHGFPVDGARTLRGIILHLRDRHEEADDLLHAAIAALVGRGDRGVGATALAFRSGSALLTGGVDRARDLAEQAVQLAEPLGDYHRIAAARSALAAVHAATGDVTAGRAVLAPIVELVEGAAREAFVPGLARVLAILDLAAGRPADALPLLERETEWGDTYLSALALPALGAALRTLGRDGEARAALDRGEALARALGMPRIEAEALEQRGHLDGDPELHHRALAIRAEHGLRLVIPDSLDALAALDDRPEHAARLLAASDAARVAAGLRPRHDRAATGAWDEGARMTLDEAVAYARRARGPRSRPPGGWESLTPAERQVVELAAQGLSNPEIGARLFMSRSTVKTHLSHVYAKLGVANRTELAARSRAP